ncbi:MAG: hypothetical protein K9J06_01435, partial [Flavobacteriales bacterium]|nr:hypothetical protein [Flavobacteriales bacterium]
MMKRSICWMLLPVCFALLSENAFSTTLLVTNTNDSGAGSLRDAIAASASGDTIMFTAAMFGGDNTIHLASGLGIAHDLVIIGLNDDNGTIFISGENAHRVLFVSTSSLVLEQMAMINGMATMGGAIYSPGGNTSIVCRNCYFGNNVATQRGGAIYFTSGYLELHGTSMNGNSATIEGGAIYYEIGKDFHLYNATLDNNSSGQKGGAIYSKGGGLTSTFEVIRSVINQNTSGTEGAAIFLEGRNFYMDSCTVNLNSCNGGVYKGIIHAELRSSIPRIVGYIGNTTVAQNTGIGIVSFITLNNSTNVSTDFDLVNSSVHSNSLGGIFSYATTSSANAASTVSVTTSTIANNGGLAGSFGGIYSVGSVLGSSYDYSSHVLVTNSTVVNNVSDEGVSGIFSRGKLAATSYLGVKSSIVTGNSGINMMSFAPTSPINSLGYNVFGEASVLGSAGTDQLGIGTAAVDLRPIGNYGGHTPTMMPNQGSTAIDMGTPIDLTDAQNGAIQGGRRDVGAAEYIPCTIQNAIAETLCAGDSVLFGGVYRKTTGTFVETVLVGACDSVVTLGLTVLPSIVNTQTATICFGESFTGYSASGTYTDVFTAANGCDSTRTLALTVLPQVQTNLSQSICIGESFAGYSATGTYTDVFVAANGCDSTRTLTLTVLPDNQSSIAQSICFGESFAGYSATGTYTDVFTAANGCDSTRTLNLTVLPVGQASIAQTICFGESFAGYSATGTYTDVFVVANGCDSTRTLTLTVLPDNQSSIAQSICFGESFQGYAATGIYTDVFVAANGCDSTRTLTLTVLPQVQTNLSQSICIGESFAGYTATGTYTDVFTSINGCDSTRTLVLTVHDLPEPTITQNGPVLTTEAFADYQWLLDGSDIQGATAQSHT